MTDQNIEAARIKADLKALRIRQNALQQEIADCRQRIALLEHQLFMAAPLQPGMIRVSAPITRLQSGGTVIVRKAKKEIPKKTSAKVDLDFQIEGIEI